MERTLLEVIEQRIIELRRAKKNTPLNQQYARLLKLKKLSEDSVILSMEDREFLDAIQPDRPVNKCHNISPGGKCKAGLGRLEDDRCPHFGGWTKIKVTCEEYEPEVVNVSRF